jgi:nucleotide-binding universal stress UspA family protein
MPDEAESDTSPQPADAHPGAGTIVVGVDGSDPSIEALRYAATMAKLLSSSVTAITCWRYPPAYDNFVPLQWSPEDDAEQVLKEAVATAFGDTPPAGLRTIVRQGQPASVLIDESADADMLVVGSRGLGGFAGLLLGSVSAAAAAHARCPVLVLRGDQRDA